MNKKLPSILLTFSLISVILLSNTVSATSYTVWYQNNTYRYDNFINITPVHSSTVFYTWHNVNLDNWI